MKKLLYLEGLRGLAACIVVLGHYLYFFYPAIITANHLYVNSFIQETKMAFVALSIFWNGNAAVCIFFVLSGFVLSYKFFQTKETQVLASGAIRRYFRLALPIIMTVFLGYFCLRFALFYGPSVPENTKSEWAGLFWQFNPSWLAATKEALWDTIFRFKYHYNPILWTMSYEFYGSLLVFGFLALFGKIKNRFLIYALFILFFWNTFYIAFLLGILLCDLFANPKYHSIFKKPHWFYLSGLLGLYLLSYPNVATDYTGKSQTIYFLLKNNAGPLSVSNIFYHSLGAGLFLFALLGSQKLKAFFSTKIFIFLGKISFSLYALHLIFLGTFSQKLFFSLWPKYPYAISFMITIVISFPLLLLLSHYFYKYIDKKGIWLSHKIYQKYFEPNA